MTTSKRYGIDTKQVDSANPLAETILTSLISLFYD